MSDEKTEQPTPKRLRDAREKGQVAKSQDVPSALTVMAVAVYFLAMAPDMLKTMMSMSEIPMLVMNRPFPEALGIVVSATLSAWPGRSWGWSWGWRCAPTWLRWG